MSYEIVKCGTCAGCLLEAKAIKLCSEFSELFVPRIEAECRSIAAIYERERIYGDRDGERWRERAEAMTALSRRSLAGLRDQHARALAMVARTAGFGCLNVVIRPTAAAGCT